MTMMKVKFTDMDIIQKRPLMIISTVMHMTQQPVPIMRYTDSTGHRLLHILEL